MQRDLPIPPLTSPELPRAARGYQRRATDDYIDELTVLYEAVWLERKRLLEDVTRLEQQIGDQQALETEVERLRKQVEAQSKRQRSVSSAISTAERLAEALREDARRNAELTLKKARERAEEIVADARRDRQRFDHETSRLANLATTMRADLMSTLAAVLDDLEARESSGDAPSARSDRERTTAGASPGRWGEAEEDR